MTLEDLHIDRNSLRTITGKEADLIVLLAEK